ncbi:MAG: glycosyltransferase family 2 protein [Synergistetes bacterium]|nr:glycosyltransferase family 2 protein [Synergistota bacterium]
MISIIIPTYNASKCLKELLEALEQQTMKCEEIIIIDSSSTDDTIEIAKSFGAKVITIPKQEFDHGGTRTKAAKFAGGKILIYLTQDALPYNKYAIENIIKPFYKDEKIGAAYGRQIPYPNATPFARHLRIFNYPEKSYVRSLKDKSKYGLKTCFCSNSFAAYRKSALEEIGWFKNRLIVGEDSYAVAKMLLKGYKVAYVAEAKVYHSHNYSIMQEFKRYFDIGVFHKKEKWLLDTFGKATGEGRKYLFSEIKFLLGNGCYYLIPKSFFWSMFKFIGYRLGYNYDKLPISLVKRLSMHRDWWKQD